ncbi:hypothetical protein [Nocardioides sp. AN3]
MRAHLRRPGVSLRHRHQPPQLLLLLLGIAVTLAGLIAVAAHTVLR